MQRVALVERSGARTGKSRVGGVGGGDEGRRLSLERGLEEVQPLQLAPDSDKTRDGRVWQKKKWKEELMRGKGGYTRSDL